MNKSWKGELSRFALLACATILLNSCSATKPPEVSPGHLKAPPPVDSHVPAAVSALPFVPKPEAVEKLETYTVVVNEVPVKELLFSLARDAKLNIDIHPGIQGQVTINAVKQTLPQILGRITKQVALRYELDGANLVISPDVPYWRTYKVDYVNMARDSVSEASVATEIATAGGSVGGDSAGGSKGNSSKTQVKNNSSGHFWDLLVSNVSAIVSDMNGKASGADSDQKSQNPGEGTATSGAASALAAAVGGEQGGSAKESSKTTGEEKAARVISNPVSGMLTVYASDRKHNEVQVFIDQVVAAAQKQVLIEVTIVEVELNDHYQAGVDWVGLSKQSQFDGNGNRIGDGVAFISNLSGSNLSTPPAFLLDFKDTNSSGRSIQSTLKMLESFGDVKVLSSPKIMALNNQTALLKVVDEKVYFTVSLEIEDATDNSPERRTYVSEIHTVPVGIVMSVMPQINDNSTVTLSIRPTITRITGFAADPAPRLLQATFDNLIPEIQVREMDSLLQVPSTKTVVLGGLMQNKININDYAIPLLSDIPIIGNLFKFKDNEFTKTELVIFIRPTVIQKPGLNGDFADFRDYLSYVEQAEQAFNKGAQSKHDNNKKQVQESDAP